MQAERAEACDEGWQMYDIIYSCLDVCQHGTAILHLAYWHLKMPPTHPRSFLRPPADPPLPRPPFLFYRIHSRQRVQLRLQIMSRSLWVLPQLMPSVVPAFGLVPTLVGVAARKDIVGIRGVGAALVICYFSSQLPFCRLVPCRVAHVPLPTYALQSLPWPTMTSKQIHFYLRELLHHLRPTLKAERQSHGHKPLRPLTGLIGAQM